MNCQFHLEEIDLFAFLDLIDSLNEYTIEVRNEFFL